MVLYPQDRPLADFLWLYVIELVNQFTAEHVMDESLFRSLLNALQKPLSDK